MAFVLSPQLRSRLDELVARYPKRQAALLPVLHVVQEACGQKLSLEAMDGVADYLGVAPSYVYEVVTFYEMYRTKPIGRCHLEVCTNVSCSLLGAEKVLQYLQKKLGVRCGEMTSDGKFTLSDVECLGKCGAAPMMLCNEEYVENLTREKLDAVIARYSQD